jgi:hypothetical protein
MAHARRPITKEKKRICSEISNSQNSNSKNKKQKTKKIRTRRKKKQLSTGGTNRSHEDPTQGGIEQNAQKEN